MYITAFFGEVAERLNAAASKVVSRRVGTGVRIPPSPLIYISSFIYRYLCR